MPRGERPLESGPGVLLQFARDLRGLREKAGSPTYRELSGRAHYSAAALSEAANGRRLPSLPVTLAYVAACGGDTDLWQQRWRTTSADLGVPDAPQCDEGGPAPYVGLSAFQPDDADRFFGRDGLIADLLTRIRDRRFLGVFGPSGCGKSSVLRAGLVAGRRPAVVLTPGPHPIEECAVRLAAAIGASSAVLRAEFAADPKNLHLRIRQGLTDHSADLLLVVDQFEEVFTLCHDRDERDWLINALSTAAFARTSRTRVVLGVRADFYGHCGQHPRLVDALRDAQVLVGPMSTDELRLAITEPAVRAGYRVETALVSELVAVAANQPGVLPLVSHALLETWRRRRGTTLTLAGYQAAGGVLYALARTAEEAYTTLDGDQQDIAKQILLRLIALGEGTEDTKRRATRRELDADNPKVAAVLDRLAQARLVAVDRDSVEITHEALIRHWPRMRAWLAGDREGLRIHRQLTEDTEVWASLHRDPGALYRGTRLAIAQDWATAAGMALTPREQEFLDASLRARDREQVATQRRTRRLRRLVTLLAVLLVVATAATIYAVRAQQAATEQRNAALLQNALREATFIKEADFSLATRLTLAVYRLDPSPAARSSVLSLSALLSDHLLVGHSDRVQSIAFTPDGRLATASRDRTARLWDLNQPRRAEELARIGAHTNTVTSVLVSPDGGVLATSSLDGTVGLWDITDRGNVKPLGRISDPGGGVVSLAFGPDGRTLATGSLDQRIRLWRLGDGTNPTLLTATESAEPIFSLAFSPNGHILAASSNHDVQLYDLTGRDGPRELAKAPGEIGVVESVVFSRDGNVMATAGNDEVVRLWDLSEPARPRVMAELTGHTALVTAAAFSSDDRRLATAGRDGTVRLWDLSDRDRPTLVVTLTADLGTVSALAFRPDGTVAAAGDDNIVRLFDTDVKSAIVDLCRTGVADLTQAEWDRYLPGFEHQHHCS